MFTYSSLTSAGNRPGDEAKFEDISIGAAFWHAGFMYTKRSSIVGRTPLSSFPTMFYPWTQVRKNVFEQKDPHL